MQHQLKSAILLLWLVLYAVVATSQSINLGCTAPQVFLSSTRACITCPSFSSFDAQLQRCICANPFVTSDVSASYDFTCVNCSASQAMPGFAGTSGPLTCLPCSANASVFIPPASIVRDATWDTTTGACICPAGYALTNYMESLYGAYFCVQCFNGSTSTGCAPDCASPLTFDAATATCVCPKGFYTYPTDSGTQCIPQSTIDLLTSGLPLADTTLSAPNVMNTGSTGPSFVSSLIQGTYLSSTVGCYLGNATACNALSNLCVLSRYDTTTLACALYLQVVALTNNCPNTICEVPTNLPWLYYLRSSADILSSTTAITLQLALQPSQGSTVTASQLRFVIAAYSVNGTFVGNFIVTDDLSICDVNAADVNEFWSVGGDRRVQCNLDLLWYFDAPVAMIYELFIQNADGTLYPVPAMLVFDPSASSFVPSGIDDPFIYRPAAVGATPVANAYCRRFFLYDNVGGLEPNGALGFATYARRVVVMIELQPGYNSQIYVPLLIIQYASVVASTVTPIIDTADGQLRHLRTNVSAGPYTDTGTNRVLYLQSMNNADYAAQTTVIVLCCVTFLTALFRTYGWMRRQQDLIVGFGAFVRFVLFYFNHLANLFVLFDVVFCTVFYAFFKFQANVDYLLPLTDTYVLATLYTATIMKGLVVLYRVFEQCNADVFIIDWERCKGQLKHSDADIPVSMWRSTFVANELNRLQLLRGWSVLFHCFIVAAFLLGLNYIDYAFAVPITAGSTTVFALYNPLLRIAVEAFSWAGVGAVIFAIEYLWYTFGENHPLQAFVDLCSVSNISVMILLEPQWGFYIHGESIHAYADISMEEFQQNLEREAQGNIPTRGISGAESCQTFEVFLGMYLRQFLNVCFYQLYVEQQQQLHQQPQVLLPQPTTMQRGWLSFMKNAQQSHIALTPQALDIKHKINSAFQASVREARRGVLAKFGIHAYIDFPPNILYMNGPFAGEKSGGDLFFIDDFKNYGRCFLYGLDFDLFVLYFALFAAIDSSLQNVFASLVITYVLDLILVTYRKKEGEANIARKTLIDGRFFL